MTELVNIAEALTRQARAQPDSVALVVPTRRVDGRWQDRRYTYRQLDDLSDRLAAGLQAQGYEPGTRVAFMVPPSLEFFALFFALCDYYKIYTRDGLPPLTSDFSLTRIYHEDHPSFDELFDRCFTLDRDSKLSATEVYNNMQAQGYKESKKKLTIMLEERFKGHVFVRSTKPNNVRTWVGLRALDQGFF